MLSNLIDIEPDPKKIQCGMPVEIVYQKLTDEVTLALFRPAEAPDEPRDEGHRELRRSATPPASSASTRATRSARCPDKSQLSLHLEAIDNAVRDAGLKISDVDGIFTAGQHPPALLGEALGITPRYVDGTSVGGCSFIIMVGHAIAALHHGLCDVAVVSHGESGRSQVGVTRARDTSLTGQFETPFGFGGAPTYFALIPRGTCTSTAPRSSSGRRWRCRRARGPR